MWKNTLLSIIHHPSSLPLRAAFGTLIVLGGIATAAITVFARRAGADDVARLAALCSLAFHHWGAPACVRVLREMDRISAHGFVVNDLVRDRVATGLIFALTRLARMNRLTRHDGPLSVLRAYTLPEYAQMVRDAGIPCCDVHRVPLYRAVIVRRKN